MRRDADQPVGQAFTGGRGIAAARQMPAIGVGRQNRGNIIMRHDRRAVTPAERNQLGEERAALLSREVLLAQAEPAAAAGKGCRGDLQKWPSRLATVGNDEKRWLGKLHRVLPDPWPPSSEAAPRSRSSSRDAPRGRARDP